MNKKKILFILHIPPPVHGSSIVGKQIMDSKLINSSFNTEYINLGTSKNVSDIGGMNLKKISTYFRILFTLLKKVIRNKYDLVYIAPTVSNLGFYKDFMAIVIIKTFQKKSVFHLHNKGVADRKQNFFSDFCYRFAFSDVDVILLSKLLYNDVHEFVSEEKIHICPNGIELIPDLEIKLTNKHKNIVPTILFLSNLIESKGVLVLLKSCKILSEKKIKFKCLFVGGEGDVFKDDFNEKVRKYNLSDRAFYLGKKYGKDKHEVFLNADIFAFPTFYKNETFGLVNIEAMQYSIPVISTAEGGIPDIVKNGVNGYIIQKNNSLELADKLINLIQDEQLRIELGNNGRAKFLNEYTLDQFEKTLLNILIKLT